MIDIENQVFTKVATALRTLFTNITVESVTTYSPSKFPFVCIEETDNYSDRTTQDTSGDKHAIVMYEVNVYSNKSTGKKTECKNLINAVDNVMAEMGFTRLAKVPINSNEATIYRIFARYTAVVSDSQIIYRR